MTSVQTNFSAAVITGMAMAVLVLPVVDARAKKAVNVNKTGIAIKGTDPVAYFMQQKTVAGSSKYSYRWRNATWYFSTAEHRNTVELIWSRYSILTPPCQVR